MTGDIPTTPEHSNLLPDNESLHDSTEHLSLRKISREPDEGCQIRCHICSFLFRVVERHESVHELRLNLIINNVTSATTVSAHRYCNEDGHMTYYASDMICL